MGISPFPSLWTEQGFWFLKLGHSPFDCQPDVYTSSGWWDQREESYWSLRKGKRKQWSFLGGMESTESKSTHPKFLPKSFKLKQLALQTFSAANLNLERAKELTIIRFHWALQTDCGGWHGKKSYILLTFVRSLSLSLCGSSGEKSSFPASEVSCLVHQNCCGGKSPHLPLSVLRTELTITLTQTRFTEEKPF